MAHVLVGYELGGGHGHVYRLMPIVRALEAQGHRVTFFLRNLYENAGLLASQYRAVLPVPDLSGRIPGAAEPAALASYLDIMCTAGFLRRQTLHAGLLAWQTLLRQANPDLVVADHSPMLLLACFGRIPVVQVADGFTMPPAEGDWFPLFRKSSDRALVDPELVLRVMQDVRRAHGLPVPATVTEPFRTAGRFVCTLPELDPYGELRRDPVIGPVEGLQAPTRPPRRPRVFAYLSLANDHSLACLRALGNSGLDTEIVARGMTDRIARELARPGLTVHWEPQPMDAMLARASLLLHHGGNGSCCAALSAGRPQLLLPNHIEARLSADAVVARGCGRLLTPEEVQAGRFVDVLKGVAGDEAMAARALALAEDIAARGPAQTVERIVAACLGLLAGDTPTAA